MPRTVSVSYTNELSLQEGKVVVACYQFDIEMTFPAMAL